MLGQPRTTQRRARKVASDEGALRGDIVRLASRFGRYGYRRVTDMLRIGNNLNQLAQWANTHKTAAEAVAVIAHLVSFERSLLAVARLDGDGGGAH